MIKKVFIASDHAGFSLKQELVKLNPEIPWEDLGPQNSNSVDYPDYARALAKNLISVSQNIPATQDTLNGGIFGVLICGSGQGMAMQANRHPEIRAALCWNEEIAKLSREHNNANVLCLGARNTPLEMAQKILSTFLASAFEGGRHSQRVAKLC